MIRDVRGPWRRALPVLALLAAALVGLAAGRLFRRVRDGGGEGLGAAAPPLALADLSGRNVSLDGLRGKVVAVNFWATWCGPCLQEIPELVRVHARHGNGCFELLGVAESSAPADAAALVQRLGISYPVLLDPGNAAGAAWRVPAYPRTFVVDAQGRVRNVFKGALDQGELEEAIRPLLAEAGPACRG